MSEELDPLSPLDLCINLVNARIGHYRRAKFSHNDEELPGLLEAITNEARLHSGVWDDFIVYSKSKHKNDKEFINILDSVCTSLLD